VDLQVNFQWFIWAPFPDIGKVFSARWTGTLVPDVSVDGSIGVNYDAGSARYPKTTFSLEGGYSLLTYNLHRMPCAQAHSERPSAGGHVRQPLFR
jgi:hypothetical protein